MATGTGRGFINFEALGYLSEDSRMDRLRNGVARLRFRLEIEKQKRKATGEWVRVLEYHTLVMFGTQAETIEKWMRKGVRVLAKGEIVSRKFKDEKGKEHQTNDFVIDDIVILSKRGEEKEAMESVAASCPSAPPTSNLEEEPQGDANLEELPF